MSRLALLACVLWLPLAVVPPCAAAQPDGAQQEIERGPGKVYPLSEILAQARRIVPGKVIDVELEYDVDFEDGQREARWVYEVEILTDDNRIVELEFDAHTGRLLEIEGAPWPADIPRENP